MPRMKETEVINKEDTGCIGSFFKKISCMDSGSKK